MLLMTACGLCSSCSTFEDSGLPGSASSMAHNQIMWVDRESQSFGYYRLQSQRRAFPDLEVFLGQKGQPDFLAETSDERRRYFILYYLGPREAFACRTAGTRRDAVEFSGPYPISEREWVMLTKLKTGRSSAPVGDAHARR
jgi:hypothetical protein